MKNRLLIFFSVVFYLGTLVTTAALVSAQCGGEGLDACYGNPARACKRGDKNASALGSENQATAHRRSEIVPFQREKVERAPQRRKQVERADSNETAKLLKTLTEYDRQSKTLNLFPVEGFKHGAKQTTYFSLVLGSEECDRIDNSENRTKCYVYNGYHFYFDKNNVSDHLYVNRFRLGGMLANWTAYGFDWDLSYDDWLNVFKKLGCQTLATEKPRVAIREGSKFFEAELMTVVKTPNGRMRLSLSFTNGFDKTTAQDKGTLFSITVDKIS